MDATTLKQMLYRLIEEGINKGNETVFRELLSEHFESHGFQVTEGVAGSSDITKQFKSFLPDFKIIIKDIIVEGNKIASRGTVSGTHTGSYLELKPTGRQITIPYMDMWRVEDGKFVENWTILDILKLLRELGMVSFPKDENSEETPED